jgi:hypothetical protein
MQTLKHLQVLPVLAVLCLLSSCGSGDYAHSKSSISSDTVALAYEPEYDSAVLEEKKNELLIRKGYLDIKVKDMRISSAAIFDQVKRLNGEVYNSKWTTEENRLLEKKKVSDTTVHVSNLIQRHTITIKIPKAKMDTLMELIAKEAVVIQLKEITTENAGLDYLSNELKSRNGLQLQKSYSKQRDRTSPKLEEITFASAYEEARLDNIVDKQINNLKLKQESEISTLEVSLVQDQFIFVSNYFTPNPDNYESPYHLLLWDALRDGFNFCSSLFLFLIRIWPLYILIFLFWKIFRKISKWKIFETSK